MTPVSRVPPITAHLIAGNAEPAGGILPTHWACLVEGPRPHWHLVGPAGLFAKAPVCMRRWFTSPPSVVADAMVMVGIAIEKLPLLSVLFPG